MTISYQQKTEVPKVFDYQTRILMSLKSSDRKLEENIFKKIRVNEIMEKYKIGGGGGLN